MARALVNTVKPYRKNWIINGAFDFAQWRSSTALTSLKRFACDRWQGYRASDVAGSTMSQQSSGDPIYGSCLRLQRDSGNTSTNQIFALQNVESANARRLAGKTMTFSFLARAGANYSAASSNMLVVLATGTGTDETLRVNYTGGVNQISQNVVLTTSFQRFTFTVTLPSGISEIGVQFSFTPVGTAGAADYFELAQVSLQEGSTFQEFTYYTQSLGEELEECKRWYQRGFFNANGPAISASQAFFYMFLPTPMRTTGTVRFIPDASLANAVDETLVAARTPTTILTGIVTEKMVNFNLDGMSGLTGKNNCRLTGDVVECYAEPF